MPEPITIAALAIGALSWTGLAAVGGHIGNVTDRLSCNLLRAYRYRMAGLSGVPERHDLARAVRIAQMQALERTIRDYRDANGALWQAGVEINPDKFIEAALDFCARIVGRSHDLRVKLDLNVTEPMIAMIDGILAEPVHEGPSSRRMGAIAVFAEDCVLDELREHIGGVTVPPGFEEHFRMGGPDGYPRFLESFGAYIVEQIKEHPNVYAILTTGQLARIEGLAFDATEILYQIQQHFGTAVLEVRKIVERSDARLVKLLDNQKEIIDNLALISSTNKVGSTPANSIEEQDGIKFIPLMKPNSLYMERFIIKAHLGRGGFGDVYLGTDTRNPKEDLAIKLLRFDGQKPEIVQAMRHELEVAEFFAKDIAIPGLISPREICWLPEQFGAAILQEYIPSMSIYDIMKVKPFLSIREAIEIAIKICKPVGELHELGLIHGDIKPSNIIISNRRIDDVYLCDTGSVWAFQKNSRLAISQIPTATPPYGAPEVLMQLPIDGRADIYSLCVTLLHMIGGIPMKRGRDLRYDYSTACIAIDEIGSDINASMPGLKGGAREGQDYDYASKALERHSYAPFFHCWDEAFDDTYEISITKENRDLLRTVPDTRVRSIISLGLSILPEERYDDVNTFSNSLKELDD